MRTLAGILCFVALLGQSAFGGTHDYLKKSHDWFGSDEAARVAENIISWQAEAGGWPKNKDVTAKPYDGDTDELRATFDNKATTDEMRFLARIYSETGDEAYLDAFERGFEFILESQYKTGGWPQRYPAGNQYHRHITFNDGAMVRILFFLQEVLEDEDDDYDFLDRRDIKHVQQAFDAGIECILKCQVEVDGELTVWCAQHDEKNYEPRPARSFELTSLSGSESVGIVRFLMSLDRPSDEVVESVEAAVAWFEKVQINGIRIEKQNGNKVVVEDDDAPPLWARFYEIGTNRPFFSGRDGIKKYDIAEIEAERRNGYAWYGNWPRRLIEDEFPDWD